MASIIIHVVEYAYMTSVYGNFTTTLLVRLFFSLFVAPPLTLCTLVPLLKGVKNWRKLAKQLIQAYDKDEEGFPHLPGSEDLDALQRQYGSDEDCLRIIVEIFLQGKGGIYEKPSWMAVLQSLYHTYEHHLASRVKNYAEPLPGVCTFACTVYILHVHITI